MGLQLLGATFVHHMAFEFEVGSNRVTFYKQNSGCVVAKSHNQSNLANSPTCLGKFLPALIVIVFVHSSSLRAKLFYLPVLFACAYGSYLYIYRFPAAHKTMTPLFTLLLPTAYMGEKFDKLKLCLCGRGIYIK